VCAASNSKPCVKVLRNTSKRNTLTHFKVLRHTLTHFVIYNLVACRRFLGESILRKKLHNEKPKRQ